MEQQHNGRENMAEEEPVIPNWRQKFTAHSQLKLTTEDAPDTEAVAHLRRAGLRQECLACFEHGFTSHTEHDVGVHAEAGRRVGDFITLSNRGWALAVSRSSFAACGRSRDSACDRQARCERL